MSDVDDTLGLCIEIMEDRLWSERQMDEPDQDRVKRLKGHIARLRRFRHTDPEPTPEAQIRKGVERWIFQRTDLDPYDDEAWVVEGLLREIRALLAGRDPAADPEPDGGREATAEDVARCLFNAGLLDFDLCHPGPADWSDVAEEDKRRIVGAVSGSFHADADPQPTDRSGAEHKARVFTMPAPKSVQGRDYQARCSCGWRSGRFVTKSVVERKRQRHLENATPDPDDGDEGGERPAVSAPPRASEARSHGGNPDGSDAPDPDDGDEGGERESAAFWLGVWHRATPGIDYTPSDAPHLPPGWATDWRRGWCDTDMIEIHEGYAAMRERGKKALAPLAGLRRSTPDDGVREAAERAWTEFNNRYGLEEDVDSYGEHIVTGHPVDEAMWALRDALDTREE